jgi:hypothetical protein
MAVDGKKVYNFNLWEATSDGLDVLAKISQRANRSQVVDHSVWAMLEVLTMGRNHLVEALRTIRSRLGEGATATVAVFEKEDGSPGAFLTFGYKGGWPAEPAEPLKLVAGLNAIARVIGDRAYVFLDFSDLPLEDHDDTTVLLGDHAIRIKVAQLAVADAPWPPDPDHYAHISLPLRRLAEVLEPDPLKPRTPRRLDIVDDALETVPPRPVD